MDPVQYYVTTLTNAAQKLGPMVLYLVGGYLLFIKLPFVLYYKVLQKPKVDFSQEEIKPDLSFQKEMEEQRRREFNERMKNLGPGQGQKKTENKEESSQKTSGNNTHQKQSGPRPAPKSKMREATPEEIIFKLKAGEVFTAKELKKRYHELLKANHPDKFRTEHQKESAEAKTKSINDAYQKLKKNVP